MWIYVDHFSTAINVSDGIKVFVTVDNEKPLIIFEYKDMDNKACEHRFRANDAARATSTVKNIVAQLKQVSDALVTVELENAIEKVDT